MSYIKRKFKQIFIIIGNFIHSLKVSKLENKTVKTCNGYKFTQD